MVISTRLSTVVSRTMFVVASIVCLAVPAHAGFIGLTWNANTEPSVTGYVVFSGTESGTYSAAVDVGNTTTWTGDSLADGRQYFFAVLAYNADGMKSPLSDELTAKPSSVAQMNSPEPGAVLENASALFQWSAGNGVTQYRVSIGTAFGGNDILDRTSADTAAKASGIPSSGTVYVRLWSLLGATWHFTDYTYTAAAPPATGIAGGSI